MQYRLRHSVGYFIWNLTSYRWDFILNGHECKILIILWRFCVDFFTQKDFFLAWATWISAYATETLKSHLMPRIWHYKDNVRSTLWSFTIHLFVKLQMLYGRFTNIKGDFPKLNVQRQLTSLIPVTKQTHLTFAQLE